MVIKREIKSISCAYCGYSMHGDDAFCTKCGKPIAAALCKVCGTPLAGDEAFCTKCGTPVTHAKQETARLFSEPPKPVTVYVEPPVAFASGLPEWSIEPPAVVVRRKARR